ncbi:MAG: hypothetical protein ACYC6G_18415 [Desulfobaccales bacterium]
MTTSAEALLQAFRRPQDPLDVKFIGKYKEYCRCRQDLASDMRSRLEQGIHEIMRAFVGDIQRTLNSSYAEEARGQARRRTLEFIEIYRQTPWARQAQDLLARFDRRGPEPQQPEWQKKFWQECETFTTILDIGKLRHLLEELVKLSDSGIDEYELRLGVRHLGNIIQSQGLLKRNSIEELKEPGPIQKLIEAEALFKNSPEFKWFFELHLGDKFEEVHRRQRYLENRKKCGQIIKEMREALKYKDWQKAKKMYDQIGDLSLQASEEKQIAEACREIDRFSKAFQTGSEALKGLATEVEQFCWHRFFKQGESIAEYIRQFSSVAQDLGTDLTKAYDKLRQHLIERLKPPDNTKREILELSANNPPSAWGSLPQEIDEVIRQMQQQVASRFHLHTLREEVKIYDVPLEKHLTGLYQQIEQDLNVLRQKSHDLMARRIHTFYQQAQPEDIAAFAQEIMSYIEEWKPWSGARGNFQQKVENLVSLKRVFEQVQSFDNWEHHKELEKIEDRMPESPLVDKLAQAHKETAGILKKIKEAEDALQPERLGECRKILADIGPRPDNVRLQRVERQLRDWELSAGLESLIRDGRFDDAEQMIKALKDQNLVKQLLCRVKVARVERLIEQDHLDQAEQELKGVRKDFPSRFQELQQQLQWVIKIKELRQSLRAPLSSQEVLELAKMAKSLWDSAVNLTGKWQPILQGIREDIDLKIDADIKGRMASVPDELEVGMVSGYLDILDKAGELIEQAKGIGFSKAGYWARKNRVKINELKAHQYIEEEDKKFTEAEQLIKDLPDNLKIPLERKLEFHRAKHAFWGPSRGSYQPLLDIFKKPWYGHGKICLTEYEWAELCEKLFWDGRLDEMMQYFKNNPTFVIFQLANQARRKADVQSFQILLGEVQSQGLHQDVPASKALQILFVPDSRSEILIGLLFLWENLPAFRGSIQFDAAQAEQIIARQLREKGGAIRAIKKKLEESESPQIDEWYREVEGTLFFLKDLKQLLPSFGSKPALDETIELCEGLGENLSELKESYAEYVKALKEGRWFVEKGVITDLEKTVERLPEKLKGNLWRNISKLKQIRDELLNIDIPALERTLDNGEFSKSLQIWQDLEKFNVYMGYETFINNKIRDFSQTFPSLANINDKVLSKENFTAILEKLRNNRTATEAFVKNFKESTNKLDYIKLKTKVDSWKKFHKQRDTAVAKTILEEIRQEFFFDKVVHLFKTEWPGVKKSLSPAAAQILDSVTVTDRFNIFLNAFSQIFAEGEDH